MGAVLEEFRRWARSPGSLGHPELCARPCLFYASGACAGDASCDFCHLEHSDPPAKMDKRQRERLLALPRERALQLALETLRQKLVAASGASSQCWLAYAKLCGACGAPASEGDGPRDLPRGERAIAKKLATMNCRRLLIMLRKTLFRESSEAQMAAEELVQQMLLASRP